MDIMTAACRNLHACAAGKSNWHRTSRQHRMVYSVSVAGLLRVRIAGPAHLLLCMRVQLALAFVLSRRRGLPYFFVFSAQASARAA
jgi:hypothetical protein